QLTIKFLDRYKPLEIERPHLPEAPPARLGVGLRRARAPWARPHCVSAAPGPEGLARWLRGVRLPCRLQNSQGIHAQSNFFHCDHTYRITARAIAPPMTILTASPPFDGAMPTMTRYTRPRISALMNRMPSTAPHFFMVKRDKPPRL